MPDYTSPVQNVVIKNLRSKLRLKQNQQKFIPSGVKQTLTLIKMGFQVISATITILLLLLLLLILLLSLLFLFLSLLL